MFYQRRRSFLSLFLFLLIVSPVQSETVSESPADPRQTASISSVAEINAIPAHGTYSQTWLSDWSKLPTGKQIAKKDLPSRYFTNANSPLEYTVTDDTVVIRDIAVNLNWSGKENDWYGTNFIHVRNVDTVIIDNVAIRQMTPDQDIADDTIRIQGCKTAIVKNSYFSGPTTGAHIRIDNCKNVFVVNNEIAGTDFTPDDGRDQFKNGAGILITHDPNYGYDAEEGVWSINYTVPQWWSVENNYIHDYTEPGEKGTGAERNQDGVTIVSPPDGIFFNNVIENWRAREPEAGEELAESIDACYDFAFEIDTKDWANKVFRVERNVFINNEKCKTTQRNKNRTDAFLFVNNLYLNTYLKDYHKGSAVYYIHNTFYFDADFHKDTYLRLSQSDLGMSHFYNNMIYSSGTFYWDTYNLNKFCYESVGVIGECVRSIQADYNFYHIAIADYPGLPWWVTGNPEDQIEEFAKWRANGKDRHSLLHTDPNNPAPCFKNMSADIDRNDYRLLKNCPAIDAGSAKYLQLNSSDPFFIDRSFNGKRRGKGLPDAGAFEFSE